jgi:hypothetical protein
MVDFGIKMNGFSVILNGKKGLRVSLASLRRKHCVSTKTVFQFEIIGNVRTK